jgi:hypothetical protein
MTKYFLLFHEIKPFLALEPPIKWVFVQFLTAFRGRKRSHKLGVVHQEYTLLDDRLDQLLSIVLIVFKSNVMVECGIIFKFFGDDIFLEFLDLLCQKFFLNDTKTIACFF